jgi:hypothetical protein
MMLSYCSGLSLVLEFIPKYLDVTLLLRFISAEAACRLVPLMVSSAPG